MFRFASITDWTTSSSRRWRVYLPLALLATLIGLVAVISMAGTGATSLPPPALNPPVRIASVMLADDGLKLRLPGVTRASQQADLAFLHAGQLARRDVQRGQRVPSGAVLAQLHNPALAPALAAAQAQVAEQSERLQQLERELIRQQDLHQRNLVPTEELERARSRRNAQHQALGQAEARLSEAGLQEAEALLRAPFAGTVTELHVEPGQFVTAGQPILSLTGDDELEVIVALGAERATSLTLGQRVPIRAVGMSASEMATIREIGLASPGRAASVVLALDQGSEPWQPGQPVHVELSFPGRDVLTVPLAAVLDPAAGDSHLFRVVDERVLKVPVSLGNVRGDRVEVEGPLSAGDAVVVAGHGQLLDEDRVRVLP